MSDYRTIIFLAVVFAILITIIYLGIAYNKKQKAAILNQKNVYEKLLKEGNDKQAALIAGRKYYSMLRDGRLSIFDEQAIANDLSAMKTT